jgi:tripartite-type tricarboxylate transporter receptor subunit TctC
VIVDNRPAASGVVGADLVAKATPDGHTLLVVSVTFVISSALQKNLPYEVKDFAPITQLIASPMGLMFHPSVPAGRVREGDQDRSRQMGRHRPTARRNARLTQYRKNDGA